MTITLALAAAAAQAKSDSPSLGGWIVIGVCGLVFVYLLIHYLRNSD